MFEFQNVKYKDILDIDNLFINESITTCFVGKSGGGKTTILKLMNKLISPTKGKIIYKDKELEKIDTIKHRKEVIMLSQNPVIFPGTIKDNLIVGFKYQEKDIPDDNELLDCLKRVELDKKLDENTEKLSGGERQRLSLARILKLDANVYLLDEPSSALDSKTEGRIIKMVSEIVKEENKTLIMVTHSENIANQYANRIIEVHDGKIKGEGRNNG